VDSFHAIKNALEYAEYTLSAKESYDFEITDDELKQIIDLIHKLEAKIVDLFNNQ